MYKAIKENLKRVKIISKINAYLKCNDIKKRYFSIKQKYDAMIQKNSLDDLLIEKGFSDEWSRQLSSKKLEIYFIGVDEYQDKSGFLQALNKFGNINYFIKKDNSYGRYNNFKYYNAIPASKLNTDEIMENIEKLIKSNKKPDLIIMQALGASYEIDRLKEFKEKYSLKFINICLDDRLVYEIPTPKNEKYNYGASGLISLVDLALVANPEIVGWYLKENVPAILFPMASSLDFYHPISNVKKKYDVGFIGNKYGYREELVNSLISAGIKVEARGTGWSSGRIKLEENNLFFNECKVVLGIGTVGHCKDFYTQKLRDFDAPLSGSAYVTHNNEDLKMFFDKDEIILCNNIDEYIEHIKWLLENDTIREEIARKAFYKAKDTHTYENRFKDLFKTLKIYKSEFDAI